MTTISAKTILRSRHSQKPDLVLSTLLLRYPRVIHSEFMTHRKFSRNAGSSRAIPVEKSFIALAHDPFEPLWWGKNQPGMQAHEELEKADRTKAKRIWRRAQKYAMQEARRLRELGVHKQIVNRLLEPFAHITVLASSTEWNNFLALRDHPDAEPHIQMLAREVRRELEREDNIQVLRPGEWHLPFITPYDIGKARALCGYSHPSATLIRTVDLDAVISDLIKLSVARCASTSYKTVDGFDMTPERAIELHDGFVNSRPLHASPFEHVAQADEFAEWDNGRQWAWEYPNLHGNFTGFKQYRKMLPNECVEG